MSVKSTSLNFGMVSAPVRLEKIEDRQDVSFQLGSPEGHAVKQVYVDTTTGEIVGGRNECARGIYDDPKNKTGFRNVPTTAIEAIDESCAIDGITIDGFISLDEADQARDRATACYYLAPGKGVGPAGVKPLVLLRETLRKGKVAGIGKLSLRTVQRPFVVYARGDALILNTLVFAEDFAPKFEKANTALGDVTVEDKTVGMALTLVESLKVSLSDLDALTDDSREKRAELVEMALAGQEIVAPEAPAVEEEATIDIEAALLASIKTPAPKKKAAAKKEKVAA